MGTRSSLTPNAGLFDRRIIPIHHSYTIHHAILAWNWSPYRTLNADWAPGASPAEPIDSVAAAAQGALWAAPGKEIQLNVGVGIGTGMGADGFGYSEVGTLSISNPNNYPASSGDATGEPDTTGDWDTSLIDRITSTSNAPRSLLWAAGGGSPIYPPKWNWELHSIPLSPTSHSAPGYYAQGDPIFVGPGWTTTKDRTNVDSAAPPTGGAEQWIEVRSLLNPIPGSPSKNLDTTIAEVLSSTLGALPSILVGYGGCYVYLICKKHLTK